MQFSPIFFGSSDCIMFNNQLVIAFHDRPYRNPGDDELFDDYESIRLHGNRGVTLF